MDSNASEIPSIITAATGVDIGYHNYKLLRIHGSNAIGTVEGYGRLWFVKSAAPDCRSIDDCLIRLKKEYDILLSLRRGPVADAVAFCEIEGAGLSIVMEYVDGVHLDKYMQTATRRQRDTVLRKLIEAVTFIHSRGVTHLDLKPENILISGTYADPQPVLIDFNLSDSAIYTHNKEVGGNAEFAAPEQFEAGYAADPRADVWSLGKLFDKYGRGFIYRRLTKASLQVNPDKRPKDASALLVIENRQRKYLRTCIVAAIVTAVAASLTIFLPQREETSLPDSASTAEAPADTVPASESASVAAPSPQRIENLSTPSTVSADVPNREFAAQMKQYDAAIANAKKEYRYIIDVFIPNWKGDPARTAVQHKMDFGTDVFNRLIKISTELMNLRRSFPDELNARHEMEWCTEGDPQLRGLQKEFKAAWDEKVKELQKNADEQKARKEVSLNQIRLHSTPLILPHS